MAEYRNSDGTTTHVERRGGMGRVLVIVLAIVALIAIVLFATGFWSADVTKSGALPKVSVDGGALPKVDLDSKKVVVGTKETEVEVPKVKTEKETISVPAIGVSDGEK